MFNITRMLFGVALAAGVIAGLAGCGGSFAVNPTEIAATEPPLSAPTPISTVSNPIATTPTPAVVITPQNSSLTLTLWTVEDVSALAQNEEAAAFLTEVVSTFESENPDFKVNVLVKKTSGKGGVLDFLRTSRDVAPSVLPDVVVMDATDLNPAYVDGLVESLDGRLDRAIVQDLLPAARRVGTVDGKLVGVPLGLKMEHAVYNMAMFSEAPITWTQVLSSNTHYLFPAKGINGLVNDTTLAQYFSAGGEFVGEDGRPKIDDRVLTSVLKFYETALSKGIIDATLLDASTTEDLWPTYLAGKAGVAQLSVSQYLIDRDKLRNSSVTGLPVPTAANTQVSVMHARVMALVTDDPVRQDAALKLIAAMLSTQNNAAWNEINKSIPVRDTSFQQLAGSDPYWQFLTSLLNTARPEPRLSGYDRIGRILQQALEQVIRGEASAEEATSTAVDALAQ